MPKTKRVHGKRVVTIDAAERRAFDTVSDCLLQTKYLADDSELALAAEALQLELVKFLVQFEATPNSGEGK